LLIHNYFSNNFIIIISSYVYLFHRPIIEFVFTAVTVIVLDEEQSEIKKTLDKLDLKITIKFVSIKQDDDLGTADALRKVPKHGEVCLFLAIDGFVNDWA
jgi:NDP-sugar pyrophosphorylase family protein